MKALSPNQWTAREFSGEGVLISLSAPENGRASIRLLQARDMSFVFRRSLWLFQVPRLVLGTGDVGTTEK